VRILVVAATEAEIAPLIDRFTFCSAGESHVTIYGHRDHAIDVLVTGIGMVATAARSSHAIATNDYDLALNLGVCGSFDPAIEPGSVVHVSSEQLSELGAEDGDAFLTVRDLKLAGEDEFPFTDGRLMNAVPPRNEVIASLPSVRGITVNTVHGSERSIAAVRARCQPQVESMEGAAFMYACLIHQLPFAEIRAVSNIVERRNREAWKLAEAIASLNDTALRIIDRA